LTVCQSVAVNLKSEDGAEVVRKVRIISLFTEASLGLQVQNYAVETGLNAK